jgi:2-amino-4-hydroxy-6-hydroxymethyldihydropteridine diphosphokinase
MTAQVHQAVLLLGSNIRPAKNLALAVDLLRRGLTVEQLSSVWQTASVGSNGPDFLNQAVLVATTLQADDLKEKVLRPLETQLGRVRSADRNAPRTIDIDVILFDGQLKDQNLFRQAYRAIPVAELLPDLRSSNGETLAEAATRLTKTASIRKEADPQKVDDLKEKKYE